MDVERYHHTSPPSLLTETIPIIDLSDPDYEFVARAIAKASKEWGTFQVVSHGIPEELMRRLKEVSRQFFELPESEKEAVAKDSKDMEGYFKKDIENVKDWDDHLLHRIWPQSCINYRHWPHNPSDYREVTEEYARNVTKLTDKILGCLSKGLGLRPEAMKEGLGGDATEFVMRVNYYPPSDSLIGAPPHTDLCGLALIVSNEVPGLQVFKDNHWFDVEYINSAIVVLIGDQIMRMSNGKYKNVLHRSRMDKENTRMTWPVLVEPKRGRVVGPLPELTADKNPPKFESLTFKDYIYRKFNMLLRDS